MLSLTSFMITYEMILRLREWNEYSRKLKHIKEIKNIFDIRYTQITLC